MVQFYLHFLIEKSAEYVLLISVMLQLLFYSVKITKNKTKVLLFIMIITLPHNKPG